MAEAYKRRRSSNRKNGFNSHPRHFALMSGGVVKWLRTLPRLVRLPSSGYGPVGVVACLGSTRTLVRVQLSRLRFFVPNGKSLQTFWCRTRCPNGREGSSPSGNPASRTSVAELADALLLKRSCNLHENRNQDVGKPGNPPASGAGKRGFKSHRPD